MTNAGSAGRLDQIDGQVKYLTAAGDLWELGQKIVPFPITGMEGTGVAIDPQDHGVAFESTEHQRHPRHLPQMSRRFVAAAAQVEPDDPVVINDVQGIHALGGQIDASVTGRRGDKKQVLSFNERAERRIEFG